MAIAGMLCLIAAVGSRLYDTQTTATYRRTQVRLGLCYTGALLLVPGILLWLSGNGGLVLGVYLLAGLDLVGECLWFRHPARRSISASLVTDVRAGREAVFMRIADRRHLAALDRVESVDLLGTAPVGAGSEFRLTLRLKRGRYMRHERMVVYAPFEEVIVVSDDGATLDMRLAEHGDVTQVSLHATLQWSVLRALTGVTWFGRKTRVRKELEAGLEASARRLRLAVEAPVPAR